jgi:hypothetical protein
MFDIRYGSGAEGFINYIWDIHSTFPQFPIWVTEFADTSDNETGEPSILQYKTGLIVD